MLLNITAVYLGEKLFFMIPLGYRLVDPQLRILWQCYDEIHDQQQDRRMKN